MKQEEQGEWARAESIFVDAMRVAGTDRVRFAIEACAGDEDLLTEVLSLLSTHATERDAGAGAVGGGDPQIGAGPSWDHWVGRTVAGYEIGPFVGEGSMGAVFRAHSKSGDDECAIKVLKSRAAGDVAAERFIAGHEQRRVLDHPAIAQEHEAGFTDDAYPFYVTDFVHGEPIDHYADARAFGLEHRMRLMLLVCGAVQYAHECQVVHHGIRPSNVLVTESGDPIVVDFGIEREVHPHVSGAPSPQTAPMSAFSPGYSSPEQLEGIPVTSATDVFSLGALGYRLFAGEPPRLDGSARAPTPAAVLGRIVLRETLVRSRRTTEAELVGHLEDPLGDVLSRACEIDPQKRFNSAQELTVALESSLAAGSSKR